MTYHKLLVTNFSSLFPWEPRNYPWMARRDNCTHHVCFQQPFGTTWTSQVPGPNEKITLKNQKRGKQSGFILPLLNLECWTKTWQFSRREALLEISTDGFEATWNLEISPQHLQRIQDSLLSVRESNSILSGGNAQIAGENYIPVAAKFHRFSY